MKHRHKVSQPAGRIYWGRVVLAVFYTVATLAVVYVASTDPPLNGLDLIGYTMVASIMWWLVAGAMRYEAQHSSRP